MKTQIPTSIQDLKTAITEEKLSGKNICIHSSIKSFGGLENGPQGIIEAFLKEDCTIIVPTFTDKYEVNPEKNMMPMQNGWDYSYKIESCCDEIYSIDSVEIEIKDMGILPTTIVNANGRIRGNHPLNSFSAIGKNAEKMIKGQKPLNVYYPLEKLVDENGYVILMGVDYNTLTLLHLAEQKAGRNLFRRWAKDEQGKTMMAEVGSCSDGFTNFSKYFNDKEIAKERMVGKSLWKIINAKELLAFATTLIKENPNITMCDKKCLRCLDAVKGGPIM